MGHYITVKCQAVLSEIGVEVVKDLQRTKSLFETVKTLEHYSFLEAFYNRTHPDKYSNDFFLNLDGNKLIIDCEFKDSGQAYFIRDFLPYLIQENYCCDLFVQTEWLDYPSIYRLEPKQVIVDYDRKFGDPTGIEIGKL